MFVDDDERLQSDVVFGVTRHLIGNYRQHDASETSPAPDVQAPWYTLDYTFVMSPGAANGPCPRLSRDIAMTRSLVLPDGE